MARYVVYDRANEMYLGQPECRHVFVVQQVELAVQGQPIELGY